MKLGIKFATLGATLAAAALAATPMMASAADGDVDAAAFIGNTTSLTPVLLVGGAGNYQFTTESASPVTGACVGASSAGPLPEAGVDLNGDIVSDCDISSTGSYVNTVCGTGTADGTATADEADGSDTFGIHIQFVSGVGIVTGPGLGAVPPLAVVVLVPSSPATAPACVNGFTVVGAGILG